MRPRYSREWAFRSFLTSRSPQWKLQGASAHFTARFTARYAASCAPRVLTVPLIQRHCSGCVLTIAAVKFPPLPEHPILKLPRRWLCTYMCCSFSRRFFQGDTLFLKILLRLRRCDLSTRFFGIPCPSQLASWWMPSSGFLRTCFLFESELTLPPSFAI